MPAVPRIRCGGVPTEAITRCTEPGRANASITERNVVCADNTLSAKPAGSSAIVVITSPLTAHHCVKVDLGGRDPRGLLSLSRKVSRAQRRDHHRLDHISEFMRLHQRIA